MFVEDSARARACRACHNCKKECPVPDTRPDTRKGGVGKDGSEAGTEAGPSKKRKVAPKGKGKGKELPALELGEDVGTALLTEIRGLCDDFRTLGEVGKAILRLLDATKNDVEYIAGVVEKREMDNTGVLRGWAEPELKATPGQKTKWRGLWCRVPKISFNVNRK
jgi:hypothetical protein